MSTRPARDTPGDGRQSLSVQYFRSRDPDGHGVSTFDVRTDLVQTTPSEGIVTESALGGNNISFVEEPVSYHDDDRTHGRYRLHVESVE